LLRSQGSGEVLAPREYKQLARRLREIGGQPADLLGPAADETLKKCQPLLDCARLERLLRRGFQLSQAIERWQARAIWVMSRADGHYPKRLKERAFGRMRRRFSTAAGMRCSWPRADWQSSARGTWMTSSSSTPRASAASPPLPVKVLGDETLRAIARELVATVRANVTIDWTLRENVRAHLRVLVKRILRKHGYPPDKQEKATQTVLEQAEVLSQEWAAAA